MQFELTEQQRLIQDMARDFFQAEGTSKAVRAACESPSGYNENTWHKMAVELGFAGLNVAAEYGGQGLGLVESAIVFEAMGRVLLPAPLLATGVLGTTVITQAGSEKQRQCWLPKVAGGVCRVAVAVCSQGGSRGSEGVDALLVSTTDGYLLSGTYNFVLDAHFADLLILAARGDAGVSLVVLEATSPGFFPEVVVERHVTMDQTRTCCRVSVENLVLLPEQILGVPGSGADGLDIALQSACLLLAAEQAGAAAVALERTVAYALERKQFGRVIGSFQAVKHRLADMMVAVEAAISAVYFAACSADENPALLPQMASLAKAQGTETLSLCAGNMIQLHGGIGFTWEHDAHLYFKRARASSTLFGSIAVHRERLAQYIGLDEETQRSA